MAFITAETRSSIVELAMGMLNQAPSTAMLNTLIAKSIEGASIQDLADYIATTDAFTAEYPATQTAREFATEMFGKLITGGTLDADINTAVIDLLEGLLIAGTTKAQGFVAVIEFLANPANVSHPDLGDISQSFQNRADAAEYFSITKELGGSTDAELAAAIASVTSDADTLTAANAAADATADAEEVVAGQTFTLTNNTDVNSAITFNAPRVYTPGGNDRVNSLQDEDSLTGLGNSASLTAVLGEPNDAAGAIITPAMSNIKTVNVTFAASNTAMTLNMQDSVGTETVNVSRISGGQIATVDDLLATTTALSVSNTNAQGVAHLLYQDSQLDGTQEVTVTLDDADLATILVGSTAGVPTEGIETLNINASGALSTVTSFDNLADNVNATNQNINITAAVDLTITGFTDDGEISAITASGAGDVTLGETGSRSTATQESTVDASALTGSLTVNYTNLDGNLASSVTGGAGDDSITNSDGAAGTWGADTRASLAGGAGDDAISVDGSVVAPAERDGDDGEVTVDGGEGDDTITIAAAVQHNVSVTGGAGSDSINIGGAIAAITGTAADGDAQGSVDGGDGDDTITFNHFEVGNASYASSGSGGITSVAGGLVGGDGSDTLAINSNETTTTVATSNAADAARISGVETVTLTAAQAISAGGVKTVLDALGTTTFTANDADDLTADFVADLAEIGATNVNLVNAAVQLSNTTAGSVTSWVAGDATSFTLTNVSSDHVITATSDEVASASGRAGAYAATAAAKATVEAADTAADITLDLTLAATTGQTTVANAARNDALTINLAGSGDFTITDSGTGTTTSNDIDSLTLAIADASSRTIALAAGDFATALTITGSQAGTLTVSNIEATTVNTSAITANTSLTLLTDEDKTLTLGSGNDVVDATADTVDRDDTMDFGDGTDQLTVNALASANDLTNSNDEYFENMTSLERVNLRAGADVVLDDDAQSTGITALDIDGGAQSDVSIQSDFSNAVAISMGDQDILVLDNDANVDIAITQDEEITGDTTITLTDAGTGSVTVSAFISAAATDVSAAATANTDLVITAAAGSIDSITLKDSAATANAAGAITVTASADWAGAAETIIFDLTDLNDDDSVANAITDSQTVTFTAAAVAAGDYAVDYRGSDLVDTFTGSAQADTVSLGAGADTYNSTAGADTITGGAGADNFAYATIAHSSGGTVDTISDFTTGSDTITFTFSTGDTVVDLGNFASNRASLADSLSTLDGNAGDAFYATNGTVAVDVDGDGNISDGIDFVVDTGGAVAAGDLRYNITVTGAASVTGSAAVDLFTFTALTAQTFNVEVGAVDEITTFTTNEDVISISIADIEAISGVTDLVDLDVASLGAQNAIVSGDPAGDLVNGTGDDIIEIGNNYATAALLETAIEAGGADVFVVNGAVDAGDAMLIKWDDGTDSYLGVLTFGSAVADNGSIVSGDATITTILQLTGVADNTTLSTAGDFVLVA